MNQELPDASGGVMSPGAGSGHEMPSAGRVDGADPLVGRDLGAVHLPHGAALIGPTVAVNMTCVPFISQTETSWVVSLIISMASGPKFHAPRSAPVHEPQLRMKWPAASMWKCWSVKNDVSTCPLPNSVASQAANWLESWDEDAAAEFVVSVAAAASKLRNTNESLDALVTPLPPEAPITPSPLRS